MKTNAKSAHVFEVRLWSKKHYYGINYRTIRNKINFFDGLVSDAKTKKVIHIHSSGDLLKALEEMYKEDESKVEETDINMKIKSCNQCGSTNGYTKLKTKQWACRKCGTIE